MVEREKKKAVNNIHIRTVRRVNYRRQKVTERGVMGMLSEIRLRECSEFG